MPYHLTLAALCVGCLAMGWPAPVPAQEQKGTLIVALDTLGAQTMDPILEGRAPQAHYQAPVFDSLVGFDYTKGGIGPGVAERWELAADGSFWTFYLRPGLQWHNGDPLTAEDVKFSLERTVSPESVSSNAAALRRGARWRRAGIRAVSTARGSSICSEMRRTALPCVRSLTGCIGPSWLNATM